MNYILAKVKRLRNKPIVTLKSDYTLYDVELPEIDYCITYSPDHNLDDDSWFKIEDFSTQSYFLDYLTSSFDAKDCIDITRDQFDKISYILSYQNGDFYFQNIVPSLFLKKKTLLSFGECLTVDEDSNSLVLKQEPDAIYLVDEDVLIFKKLEAITSIFKGINTLYKEATHSEVLSFFSKPFIKLEGDFCADNVSKLNRKNIALAINSLNQMSQGKKDDIIDYINGYSDVGLRFEDDKFIVSSNYELKMLVYGLDQRFHTTQVGNQKRVANSVISIS